MRRGFTLAVARVSFEETVSRMSVSHSRLEIRFRSNEGVWVRLNGQRPRPPSLTQPPTAAAPRLRRRPHTAHGPTAKPYARERVCYIQGRTVKCNVFLW